MSRNFPNMSYCAFDNTLKAMEQLIFLMDEAVQKNEPLDMADYERRAFNEMVQRNLDLFEMIKEYEDHFNRDDSGD